MKIRKRKFMLWPECVGTDDSHFLHEFLHQLFVGEQRRYGKFRLFGINMGISTVFPFSVQNHRTERRDVVDKNCPCPIDRGKVVCEEYDKIGRDLNLVLVRPCVEPDLHVLGGFNGHTDFVGFVDRG